MRFDGIPKVLDRVGSSLARDETDTTTAGTGQCSEFAEELVEALPELRIALIMDADFRHQRFPPISPLRHNSPSR
jgi:hypothetical protein